MIQRHVMGIIADEQIDSQWLRQSKSFMFENHAAWETTYSSVILTLIQTVLCHYPLYPQKHLSSLICRLYIKKSTTRHIQTFSWRVQSYLYTGAYKIKKRFSVLRCNWQKLIFNQCQNATGCPAETKQIFSCRVLSQWNECFKMFCCYRCGVIRFYLNENCCARTQRLTGFEHAYIQTYLKWNLDVVHFCPQVSLNTGFAEPSSRKYEAADNSEAGSNKSELCWIT